MSLEEIIKEILRDYSMIDTGVSKTIAETIAPLIQDAIHNELSVAQFAQHAMQGLLANPDMSESTEKEITSISIEYAIGLLRGLDEKRAEQLSAN